MKVVIAGGGTAGHVFPAIALADRLAADGDAVSFVGSPEGQEAVRVPAAGYPFHAVDATPMKREVSLATLKAPLVALRSVGAARLLVDRADVVVGVGGYVSVPAVLAARRSYVPIVLHEQNAIPSLSNRFLSRFARAVAVSFDRSRASFGARVRVEVTGNPVRETITSVPGNRKELAAETWPALDLMPDRSTVVVFGGSLGALHVDQVVAQMLQGSAIRDRDDLQLLVLTGPAHHDVVAGPASASMSLRVRALPFLDRMDLALAIADLAVARAGAGHIAELTVCGVPSILIPYPHATENHQEANARAVVDAGAAELLLDRDLSGERLSARILGLVDDHDRRHRMADAAQTWGRPDAAERLAGLVHEVGAV
jgi:UDP-N-acetylglucosamine--N-acetylmuramyl-(pentapeptide) pyrophosphoryl-undecaprenol N-acetylglucosamine transferase